MQRADMLLLAALVAAGLLGIFAADDPYRLQGIGHPVDQMALDHRDSPYAHITWVISEANNYAELRFFDKVEGGVCLRPSWQEMAQFAPDGGLDHIAMPADFDLSGAPPHRSWPADLEKPNPGTLAKSPYVNMFPAAVLLNQRLMQEAGDNPRAARPNILIIGLGSGVGIAVLAHHFPEASIAVVDIDAAVIDMVVDHYPFMRWLREQQTSDGRPRLKMGRAEAVDARQYIRHASLREDEGRQYDVVILDAFTDGSTIPPHLMTEEFFAEVKAIMPSDGILLSNIIGSYTGAKHRILGGGMRAQRDAGFSHVFNLPLLHNRTSFDPSQTRNNIVLASPVAIDPATQSAGWNRLAEWTPYPELPGRRFVSTLIGLINAQGRFTSALADPRGWDNESRQEADDLRSRLRRIAQANSEQPGSILTGFSELPQDMALAQRLVLASHPRAPGWQESLTGQRLAYQEIDWVLFARHNWSSTIREARRRSSGLWVHHGDTLVPPDAVRPSTYSIPYAPRFTDRRPNADIFNR